MRWELFEESYCSDSDFLQQLGSIFMQCAGAHINTSSNRSAINTLKKDKFSKKTFFSAASFFTKWTRPQPFQVIAEST